MKKSRAIVILCFAELLFIPNILSAKDPNSAGLNGMKAITPERLRAQLTLIASDEFEGRETSYRGQKLAALYIASQFEQMGLRPAGDSGTFFQHFPVVHIKIDTNSYLRTSTTSGMKEWKSFGRDFFPHSSGRDTTISGDVEFAGYGIDSRILSYSDYDAAKNYAGKIVLILRGMPREEDSTGIFARNRSEASPMAKRIYAQRNGASAVMIVEDINGRTMKEAFDERRDEFMRGSITIPQRVRGSMPTFSISKRIADELLRSSGRTINDLQHEIDSAQKPRSFSVIGSRATLSLMIRHENVSSENVIGVLPGSDSLLKNEYVVFSAHHDHLGKNSATGEIYNGADDDGSGTCALLEIAHAFASMEPPPPRSLLFLSVAGEEKGLLGSLYYTEHSTVPLEKTVTDLNIDMIGRYDPEHEQTGDTNYVYLIGSDKLSSELDSIGKKANDESVQLHLDYTYDDETEPHQYYRRSDHYNFARKNIPIIFYFDGEHADYHQPTDRVEKINFTILTKRSQLVFYTGWKLAISPNRPRVDKGDFTPSPSGKR
ncbi:MAG TPA: M28 family peptidase [Bacteroidota bacterium]|nr:M28 family peptidase [Bacteroidota bacterium]